MEIKNLLSGLFVSARGYCKFFQLSLSPQKKIIRSYDSPLKHEHGLSEKHSGGVTDHYNFSSRRVHLV